MPSDLSPSNAAPAGDSDLLLAFMQQDSNDHTNPWAFGTAAVVNGGLFLLVILLGVRVVGHAPPGQLRTGIRLDDLHLTVPYPSHVGGNGGGANDLVDPTRGRPPRIEQVQLTSLQVPVLVSPTLRAEAAIALPPDIKLVDDSKLPNVGMPSSVNVGLASNGPGGHGGIGTGPNGGYGPGNGPGFGPDTGNGIEVPGQGGVSVPIPIVTPEAEFSDEARRNKYQGICMIAIIVDAQGNPHILRVARSLGMGLDEKALEAVSRYRFKPAMKQGRPVAVRMTVAVNFRLY
jgi:TonB family protein